MKKYELKYLEKDNPFWKEAKWKIELERLVNEGWFIVAFMTYVSAGFSDGGYFILQREVIPTKE